MIPPGKWRFFFTSMMSTFMLSESHDIEYLHEAVVVTKTYDKKRSDVTTFDINILA